MTFRIYGTSSLHEFLRDTVVYRKLVPSDPRLPALDTLRERLGLEGGSIPRKAEPAYGRVVAEILRQVQALERPAHPIQRLLYIGDTQMNDGRAFRNICAAGPWPGWAFIGRDSPDSPTLARVEGPLYLAKRWSLLPIFLEFVQKQGIALDTGTALVIDVDKSAIGARGRNDQVIDEARLEGVRRTVVGLLGRKFDEVAFQRAYDELNQPAYHPFTGDNQDYLAYICLVLQAGLYRSDELTTQIRAGLLKNFEEFIARLQGRHHELEDAGLAPIHDRVWACVQAGDPTPFKAFRRHEYLCTAARFGELPGVNVEQVLQQRIVITQEVRAAALELRRRGAIVLGLSDKPDEASLPSTKQAGAGMKPLHRLETVVVGEEAPFS